MKSNVRQCSNRTHQYDLGPRQLSVNHSFKDECHDEKLRNERNPRASHFKGIIAYLEQMRNGFRTLRVTPGMEAGLTDHVWTIEEMAQLLEGKDMEAAGRKRGQYKLKSA